jgi:hypothetical protein
MAGREAGLRVQGGRKFRKALADAGVSLDDLKAAHAEAARIVERAASAAAPRRSGALAGSLRSSGTKTQGVVRAGGARVPYAAPIHWGWPKRNIEASLFITKPAADTEAQWFTVYVQAVEAIIDAVEREADGTGD